MMMYMYLLVMVENFKAEMLGVRLRNNQWLY